MYVGKCKLQISVGLEKMNEFCESNGKPESEETDKKLKFVTLSQDISDDKLAPLTVLN